MLVTASKYTDVRAAARVSEIPRTPPRDSGRAPGFTRAPAFLRSQPQGKRVDLDEFFWREMKEGGLLRAYFAHEKARNQSRLRAVARRMDGFKQNSKSDWRLVAAIPARVAHRLAKEIPEFWQDDAALKSLKRDEPDARVYL